jgi:hypothetical protein
VLFEAVLKFQVVALLLRIVLIDNFLALLGPGRVSSAYEGLHARAVEAEAFAEAVDSEFEPASFAGVHLGCSGVTSKKYHCRRPWVLVSSRINSQYSRPDMRTAALRLPL